MSSSQDDPSFQPIPEWSGAQVTAERILGLAVRENRPVILRDGCRNWVEWLQAHRSSSSGSSPIHPDLQALEAARDLLSRKMPYVKPSSDAGQDGPLAPEDVQDPVSAQDEESPSGEAAAEDELVFRNVFVVPKLLGPRFKYFRTPDADTVGKRVTMRWSELMQHLPSREGASGAEEESSSGSSIPEDEDVYVYVYGEPSAAAELFPVPEYRRSADPEPGEDRPTLGFEALGDCTSTLVWIALDGSLSSLHYDMCEGFLSQVHGTKTVTLIGAEHYAELRPHPVGGAYDRQSSLPSLEALGREARAKMTFWTGSIGAGDVLYIPYGWWHEVRSSGVSVSVSQRWNPYEEAIRALELARGHLSRQGLPPALVSAMYAASLQQETRLPEPVRRLMSNRNP